MEEGEKYQILEPALSGLILMLDALLDCFLAFLEDNWVDVTLEGVEYLGAC